MARDIDRKLRSTAAVLGIVGRKELAAEFRRVNPRTSFEVARADKWLQGRSKPRERQIYEDWAKVLGLDRPGQWIAECDAEAFVDEICARHGRDREALQSKLEPSGHDRPGLNSALDLTGTFVGYSHVWSPLLHGQFMRGELSVRAGPGQGRLHGIYTEILAHDSHLEYRGPILVNKRAVQFAPRVASGDSHLFTLFLPSPPASVLGGLWSGATALGVLAQPAVTRVVMVRLPAPNERLRTARSFLPADASLAADLASLGLRLEDPAAVDRHLRAFLTAGTDGGYDQIPIEAYNSLVQLFDGLWLTRPPPLEGHVAE